MTPTACAWALTACPRPAVVLVKTTPLPVTRGLPSRPRPLCMEHGMATAVLAQDDTRVVLEPLDGAR